MSNYLAYLNIVVDIEKVFKLGNSFLFMKKRGKQLVKRRKVRREHVVTYFFIFLIIGGAIGGLYFLNISMTGFAVYQQNDQLGFDEGTYDNTEWNGSAVVLKYWSDSEQELPDNKQGSLMSGNVLLLHMNNGWLDKSGEGNNGTASGATFSTSSKLGSHAGSFDGSNDKVNCGSHSSLNLQTTLTISAWINLDTVTPAHGFHSSIIGNNGNSNWWFYVGNNAKLGFLAFDGGGFDAVGSNSDISAGQWVHVVATYNNSATNEVKLYIDGNLDKQGSLNPPITALSDYMVVGDRGDTHRLDGRIDELALWNVVLTDEEISEIYQRQKAKYGGGESGAYTSKVFNANGEASWNNISWTQNDCYGCYGDMTFYANYNSDIHGTWGEGGLTGTPYNNPGITNNKLNLSGGAIIYVDYGANLNADSQQVGAVRFKIIPDYTGIGNKHGMFSISKEHNSVVNMISLVQWHNGQLKVYMFDSLGSEITSQLLSVWSPTAGQEYEFELNWDLNNEETRLFIDGVQHGSTITTTGTRSSDIGLLRVGSTWHASSSFPPDCKIDDFTVFDKVQHASNYDSPLVLAPCLNLTARTCNDANCDGESWTDVVDSSPQDLSLGSNQYFQYKFLFETDDSSYTPELMSVNMDYTILNSAPTITLTSPQEGATYGYNESLALNFVVADSDGNLDSCWYNIDNGENISLGANGNCANTTFDVVGDGSYNINIYVNDTNGEQANDSASFNIQLGAPTIVLNSPIDVYLDYQEDIQFSYTPTDIDLDSCEFWGDFTGDFALNQTDTNPASGSENIFVLTLDDGVYLWNINCNDSQGNSVFNGNKTFYVDVVNPSINLSEPTGAKTSRTGIPLTFNVSDDNLESCWFNVYRGENLEVANTSVNCSLESTIFDVTIDADFVLNFYVNDSAGNLNSASSSFSVFTGATVVVSSGGGGGGGSSRTTIITPNGTIQLTLERIQDLVADPKDVKQVSLFVKNTGTNFLNDCKIKGEEGYASWVFSEEVKSLAAGEKYGFVFEVVVPETAEYGKYTLTISLTCTEISEFSGFVVEILEKKLRFDLIEVSRVGDAQIKIIYLVEELSGLEQEVEMQFLLFDSNDEKAVEVKEIKLVSANSQQEFEILIPVDSSLEGELSLLVNLNSETYSTFIQENIILGSPASGFAVFGERGNTDKILSVIFIILFLVFAFFIVRRILKHRKKK